MAIDSNFPYNLPVINNLTTGGGTVALSAGQGKVLNERLDTYAHPNLLRNPNFLVNRNGKAEYTGAGVTVDAWRSSSSECSLSTTDSGIIFAVAANATSRRYLSQKLERQDVKGKMLCFSALLADGNLYSGYGVMPTTPGYTTVATIPGIGDMRLNVGSDGVAEVYIIVNQGQSIGLFAVKLELGDHQTLARQLDDGTWQLIEAPDYARDYALCILYSPTTGEWVGSQHSNPNLLINWYLNDPINQRGQTSYAAAGYSIDMLYNRTTNTKLSLTDKGLKIEVATAPSGAKNQFVSQRIENYKELLGKTVTLSYLVTEAQCSGTGLRCFLSASNSVGLNTQNLGGVLVYAKAPGLYAITTTLPDTTAYSGINVAFLMHDDSAMGDYATVAAWKLELGPVSTLAHREGDAWVLNDPPPNKQQELAKCQRYQLVIRNEVYIRASRIYQNFISFTLQAPTPLRNTPTAVVLDGGVLQVCTLGGTAQTGFTFSCFSSDRGGAITIQASKTGHGMTDAYLNIRGVCFDINL